jgi:response regulator RpfG family c-di-GMP phosphodiesterase
VKFGERLVQARLIDPAQLEAGLSHQQETGLRIGEALHELGYISEDNLLKFLAKEFNTRFVSTRKLSRISIVPDLLELVPQSVAEQNNLFPVQINRKTQTLGVVTSEPQNLAMIEELRIVTGMQTILIYVALREAVQAAVKKHYKGDINAFAKLEKSEQQNLDQMMELYSDRVVPDAEISLEPQAAPKASGPAVIDLDPVDGFTSEQTSSWTRQIEAVRGGSLVSDNDFIETLNILVGLLEMNRANLQGHSAKVAKWTKAISERMGLKERDINHNIIAAYLHDLGKRSSAHLTLMSITASEDHRRRARRYHLTPARLFDSVHLPPQVNHIIGHLYEIFDGTGLPEQLSGEGIPTGAKIIAVVDAFEDLIANPTNPFGRTMPAEDALDEIRQKAERLFDPHVVDMLGEVVLGEEARAQLSSSSPLVLVADADNASTSVIELKLVKKGFRVRVARDSTTAKESLRSEQVAALLLEMRLEPEDGFQIIKFIESEGQTVPVFMVSSDTTPEAITRAFDMGVVDFINKPFVPEVIIAKLVKELSGRTQAPAPARAAAAEEEEETFGVVIEMDDSLSAAMQAAGDGIEEEPSGRDQFEDGVYLDLTDAPPGEDENTPTGSSVAEEQTMPDPPTGTMAGVVSTATKVLSGTLEGKSALVLIRALSGKRKTGRLSLRIGEQKGMIFFEKGHIFQALVGEVQSEEALLELATWRDCLYKFDPSKTAKRREIKTPTGKLIQIASLSEE